MRFALIFLYLLLEVYTTSALDTNALRVMPAADYFNSVRWSTLEKSEFETGSAHFARVNSEFPLLGKPVWLKLSDCSFKYDPENQRATIGIQAESDWGGIYCVYSTNWTTGKSEGENALGAKTVITDASFIRDKFYFVNWALWPTNINPKLPEISLGLTFPVAGDDARKLKQNSSVWLCVVVYQMDTAKSSVTVSPPTFTDPYEFTDYTFHLEAQLEGLRVVDKKTGRVWSEWMNN